MSKENMPKDVPDPRTHPEPWKIWTHFPKNQEEVEFKKAVRAYMQPEFDRYWNRTLRPEPPDGVSEASTDEYDHLPYEQWKGKVHQLLEEQLPKGYVLRKVYHMKGGRHNRVTGCELSYALEQGKLVIHNIPYTPRNDPENKENEDENEEYIKVPAILRTRRVGDYPTHQPPQQPPFVKILDRYALTAKLIAAGVCVPPILAYDITPKNAIKWNYELQLRYPGVRLDTVYDSLTVAQKIRVANLLAKVYLQTEQCTFPTCGRITHQEAVLPYMLPLGAEQPKYVACKTEGFYVGRGLHRSLHEPDTNSPFLMMRSIFKAWVEYTRPNAVSETREGFNRLLKLQQDMALAKVFRDRDEEGIAVHHTNLDPKHIIVSSTIHDPEDLKFEIEAIIKWDDAVALPAILRRIPPVWLWGKSYSRFRAPLDYDDSDPDLLAPERYVANGLNLLPDQTAIKHAFDYAVGPKWIYHMYSRRAVWIRRLWRFGKDGFPMKVDFPRLDRYEKEWQEEKKRMEAKLIMV